MKSINKVIAKGLDILNVLEPKKWSPESNIAKLKEPYVENMPAELDEAISYDQFIKIETMEDIGRYIEEQKNAGVPIWKIIASVAKIAAIPGPEKLIIDFPGGGEWAAVGENLKNDERKDLAKEYLALHNLARAYKIVDGKHNYDDFAYGSCAQAAAAVIIPIYDSELPVDSPKAQYEYLTGKGKENGKWTEVNVDNNGKPIIKEGASWSDYDLRPGDLVLTEQAADGTQHVLIYIGEEDGIPTFYEAEAHSFDDSVYPYITRQPFVDDHKNGITTDPKTKPDRQYHVFRPNV